MNKSSESKQNSSRSKLDTGELELPDTVFVRDIESRVIQSFVLQCLSKIDGVSLTGGTFFDNILGREGTEAIRGIHVEQDSRNHSVSIKAEISIRYGLSIPEKAEEIQRKIAEEITTLTGLHVSCVHVIFKSVLLPNPSSDKTSLLLSEQLEDDYSDEF